MSCSHAHGTAEVALAIGTTTVYRFSCDDCHEAYSEAVYSIHVDESRTGWGGRVVAVVSHEGWPL